MTTPAENRAAWTKALRSGDYEQGKHALHYRDDDGNELWCCLGVACDLAVKAGVIPEPVVRGRAFGYGGPGRFLGSDFGYLPEPVREWLGLRDPSGELRDRRGSLSTANDHGMPFATIADLIDQGQVELDEGPEAAPVF